MKQKEIIGAFFRVPIDGNFHTYGRIIENYRYAFYDLKTDKEIEDIDFIERSGILFKLIVKNTAIKNGSWKVIGIKELPNDLMQPIPFFIQEIGRPEICWIDKNDVRSRVNVEDCIGLERYAVWNDFHVIQKLIDHYGNKRNDYTYALRLNSII